MTLGSTQCWPSRYGGVFAPSAPLSALDYFGGFDTRKSAVVGENCSCVLSHMSSLIVVFWSC
jgi:hypothetical protein